MKMTVVWDVVPCSLVEASFVALMMEAKSTSKTSVNFYQTTRRNSPEDNQFQFTERRINDDHSETFSSLNVFDDVVVLLRSIFWTLSIVPMFSTDRG
jgi:hypothetical protein